MLKFNTYDKQYLQELNIQWSRTYKDDVLPVSYISQSLAEGEQIYDAIIKKVKTEDISFNEFYVRDLPVSAHLKKKYGNVVIKGQFKPTVGFKSDDANLKTQLFDPNKLKDKGTILDNNPRIELELVSKNNAKVMSATFAKRRFAHHWVDLKRTLLTNVLYKDFHRYFAMDVVRDAGFALAAVSFSIAAIVTNLLAPLVAVALFGLVYKVLHTASHIYFLNDPIEVEAMAITLINERRALFGSWSKEYFIKDLGPTIVSKEKFIEAIFHAKSATGVLTSINVINNKLFLTEANTTRFNSILYDAYVATMKGKL